MSKVRLGFIGVGHMGQAAHLRNYATLSDCQVAAIAELRPWLASKVAHRYEVPKVYSDYREMLATEKLDGVVAIQQFQNHAAMLPEILKAKIPVLTEKPLAESIENGNKIVAAARTEGTPLFIAYHKRSDPAIAAAKGQIELWRTSGEVGKMRYIRISMPPGDWSAQGFASNVETSEQLEGAPLAAGPYISFVNYYIHQMNLFRFLLAEDYEVIFADPGGVTLAIRSASGVSGTLEMDTYRTSVGWQESVFVSFERGWIQVDLPAPLVIDQSGKIEIFRDPGKGESPTTTVPSLPPFHAMLCQATHFLSATRGQPTPLCTAEEGLKDLHVAATYIRLATSGPRFSA